MRRRQLLVALGGATLWPVAVRAQQSAMPLVGVLSSGSAAESAPQLIALRRGLSELGYIEGKNVLFEYRWGEGHNERLPGLAADLVRQHVVLIVTWRHAAGARGKGRKRGSANTFRGRYGPGRVWTCCQLEPTGRQPDRRDSLV